MRSRFFLYKCLILFLVGIIIPLSILPVAASTNVNQKIFDFANLLSAEEIIQLENLSNKYSEKRQVDIIILTTNNPDGKDIEKYMQDFYDEMGLGFDRPHGNTVILTIDMKHREVYIAGFYKGKEYLDNSRCQLIREKITPDLSAGRYYEAFHTYITLAYRYMGIRPGVNPNNVLFKLWFQILAAISVAGIIVFSMVYNSGGRVTTEGSTYIDSSNSQVTNRRDIFVRTDVTRRKKPSNNSKTGGIGGGITGKGHSHSGSRGRF